MPMITGTKTCWFFCLSWERKMEPPSINPDTRRILPTGILS